jgi:hypothetical protein
MILNARGWARRRSEDASRTPASPRPHRPRAPILETLESRRLLSAYLGPSAKLSVTTSAGAFLIQVTGPGAVKVQPAGHGMIDLTAYGTTTASTITITQTQQRFHFPNQLLAIQTFTVRSRQLSGLVATPAQLDGRMTPLTNSMNNLDIGGLGPKAQVNIAGGLGELSASSIILGPNGYVSIAQGINAVAPPPGQSGSFTLGAVTIGTMDLSGGQFAIGADSTLPITVQGNLTVGQGGEFSIGRDEVGSITVGGSLVVDSGGQFVVGRNLNNLTVGGNLIVGPSGSGIAANGALNGLTVKGYFMGQGGTANPSAIDLGVGLNLSGLTIQSGVTGLGGLINANIRAGGNVSGVDIIYGAYKSTIRANASMST